MSQNGQTSGEHLAVVLSTLLRDCNTIGQPNFGGRPEDVKTISGHVLSCSCENEQKWRRREV